MRPVNSRSDPAWVARGRCACTAVARASAARVRRVAEELGTGDGWEEAVDSAAGRSSRLLARWTAASCSLTCRLYRVEMKIAVTGAPYFGRDKGDLNSVRPSVNRRTVSIIMRKQQRMKTYLKKVRSQLDDPEELAIKRNPAMRVYEDLTRCMSRLIFLRPAHAANSPLS